MTNKVALTIGDEGGTIWRIDIDIDGEDFTFLAVSAIQYGPDKLVRSLI